jgi:hypothetical protein
MASSDGLLIRARNDLGQYVGDDPSTPYVNEAYVVVPHVDGTTGGEA